MDYILIFWLVSTYLKSVNRNWQPCIVVVVATLWDPTMVCQTAEETTKAFLSFMCILLTDTLLFQFKIRAKYHIWFGRCLMMCVCVCVYFSDGPTSMLEANTNKSNSKLSRFQSSFRFTRLLKRPNRLHTWGPVFLFWQIIKYYSNISLIVL